MGREKYVDIRRHLTSKCAALGIPVSGIFELTPRCNLRCKMCYVRLTPAQMAPHGRELTAQEWLSIAQEAKEAGLAFLLLTGGEPTLREDFPEIYEKLSQMGLSIMINSNGTMLTPDIRELWRRLPPAKVNVTVYGTSREDYAALCGEPEAFDRMVDGLHWLKQEGILVHLNTTMAPQNAHRWLQIEKFARDMDLELRMISYCFPPTRRNECGCSDDFTRLSAEDAAKVLICDTIFREGMDGIRKRAANLSTPPQASCDLDIGEPLQCMAGRSQFWLSWNGRMSPCGILNQPESWPLRDGFQNSWQSIHQKIKAIRLCPDCVNCKDKDTCLNCAAVIYAETGTFNGTPAYMCQMNRSYRKLITDLANSSDLTTAAEQDVCTDVTASLIK